MAEMTRRDTDLDFRSCSLSHRDAQATRAVVRRREATGDGSKDRAMSHHRSLRNPLLMRSWLSCLSRWRLSKRALTATFARLLTVGRTTLPHLQHGLQHLRELIARRYNCGRIEFPAGGTVSVRQRREVRPRPVITLTILLKLVEQVIGGHAANGLGRGRAAPLPRVRLVQICGVLHGRAVKMSPVEPAGTCRTWAVL